ncbi:MAG TPA: hypothetical protein VL970_07305 [Candidatus Acidoferrales bacterium]|nr:hypothetical protein [Candidatus Acidoferrales bacterium]
MRPKVVILTLVIAFGVLGAVALFKGVIQKPAGSGAPVPATNAVQNPVPADTSALVASANPNSSNAASADELRAALIEKEQADIRTLQGEIDGTNNPVIIAALLEKMNSPEPDVRKTVLQALIEINDTNAVPGLQKAGDNLKDPREKVAVLDAIAYLKAPDIMDGLTPQELTNNYTTLPSNSPPIKPNMNFIRGYRPPRQAANGGGPAPAPASGASQ